MRKLPEIKKILLLVIVAACGILLGQLVVRSFTKLTLSDFHVYYYVTKVVMKYGMHPYSNFTPIYPYYFPPASLIIFWPLTLLPFYIAKIIFTFINSVLLFVSLYLVNKMIVGKLSYHYWILLFLSLIFYPLKFTFADGQFNVVMMALFTFGLYAFYKNKPILGGLSLGIGVVTKISPAIILLYGVFRKKFSLFMVAGITIIILSLLSEHFVKKDINYYYAKFIVKDVSSQSSGLGPTDQSLLAFIKRFTHDNELKISVMGKSLISYSVVAIFGIVFFIVDLKTKKRKYTLFIDYFILTTVGVIGTGLSWYHQYTILLLPLFGTGFLCFTKFDKKYKKIKFAYFIGLFLVYLSWFGNIRSGVFSFDGYGEFLMLYGGLLLLIGLYALKINQKWLTEEDIVSGSKNNIDYANLVFLIFLIIGLRVWNLPEVLKEGRDNSRIEALDFMSEVLKEKKVTFKVEESDSFIMSNRVGKGYIRFDKGQDSKVLDKMYILYEDPVNNEEYNYKFSSSDGITFNLGSKLESRKYKELHGEYYWVGKE